MSDPSPRLDRPYLYVEQPKPVLLKTHASEPPPAQAVETEVPPIPVAPCNRDPEEVLRIVGFAYSLSIEEIKTGGNSKTIAECRNLAYWMLRAVTKLSTTELGRAVGRDHTSLISGAKSCAKRREKDADFRTFTDELKVAVEARLNARKRGAGA